LTKNCGIREIFKKKFGAENIFFRFPIREIFEKKLANNYFFFGFACLTIFFAVATGMPTFLANLGLLAAA
jgi:hypothetical protein